MDHLVLRVNRVPQVPQDPRVLLASTVQQDRLVPVDSRVHLVPLDCLEALVLKVFRVAQVLQEFKETLVQLDPVDRLAVLD